MAKANSFILTYKLFLDNMIDQEYYNFIKIKTEDPALEYETLKKILIKVGIVLKFSPLEDGAKLALKNILDHIENRFDYLDQRLSLDSRVTVTIPGKNAVRNLMIPVETENVWRNMDSQNFKENITMLKKVLIIRIQLLQRKFEDRIKFGMVSDKYASDFSYQVWPADIGNWNLPLNSRMIGDGMSLSFKYQVPGVYGIVTNPRFGYKF